MVSSSLVSAQNRVESPFIIVKIGNYTFGACSDMSNRQKMNQVMKVTFPNYMQSLNIVKVNGAVNTYNLRMEYGITEVDDPNMLEKVFIHLYNNVCLKIVLLVWLFATKMVLKMLLIQ